MALLVLLRVEGGLARERVGARAIFDPAGAYAFEGLAPGDYELHATAQGHGRAEPRRVVLDTQDRELDITLEAGATIYGEVVDAATGAGLELALISVQRLAGRDSVLPALSSTVSGTDGGFELRGIDGGRISLHVAAFAHDAKVVSGIELEPGQTHGPLHVELSPVAPGARPKTEITGIGVAIGAGEDRIEIREVLPGGGAEAAGLQPGDSILAVDGESVAALGFADAVQNIRGQSGSFVALELLRKEGDQVSVEVERRPIEAP